MRGVHSDIDDTRRSVFREVAALAYEGGNYARVDQLPHKLVPKGSVPMRYDIFLDRAVVAARVKLALGMDLRDDEKRDSLSQQIWDAATDQKYFQEPLVNIIPFACNACPEKQVRITDSCQGCVSHPCMNVCPKDAIYLDKIQALPHRPGQVHQAAASATTSAPTGRSSKIERPCAAACGMDAIGSDEVGRAKIDYDKCVSCGMCLVNCPFGAIADKSQIFQLIHAMKQGEQGHRLRGPRLREPVRRARSPPPSSARPPCGRLGFADVVEVAIGADLCTIEEAKDFLEKVPDELALHGHQLLPGLGRHGEEALPRVQGQHLHGPDAYGASPPGWSKSRYPDARIVLHRPLRRQEAGGHPHAPSAATWTSC